MILIVFGSDLRRNKDGTDLYERFLWFHGRVKVGRYRIPRVLPKNTRFPKEPHSVYRVYAGQAWRAAYLFVERKGYSYSDDSLNFPVSGLTKIISLPLHLP